MHQQAVRGREPSPARFSIQDRYKARAQHDVKVGFPSSVAAEGAAAADEGKSQHRIVLEQSLLLRADAARCKMCTTERKRERGEEAFLRMAIMFSSPCMHSPVWSARISSVLAHTVKQNRCININMHLRKLPSPFLHLVSGVRTPANRTSPRPTPSSTRRT